MFRINEVILQYLFILNCCLYLLEVFVFLLLCQTIFFIIIIINTKVSSVFQSEYLYSKGTDKEKLV